MRIDFFFNMNGNYRNQLIKLAEACEVSQRHIVPKGFNNSIHWQIGHVLTITERLVFGISGQTNTLSHDYSEYFGTGTSPKEWKGNPPAWDLVIEHLKDQSIRIDETFRDKLEEPLSENRMRVETVEELIYVCMLHEVNHIGIVSAMNKALK
ncbi:DinB family protein [Paenibacillus glycanilyticus]|uniref:DinB family protein n=1 Tax=Paenibacillus glycanilyticus TaxID=126569 RepID=UPI00203E7888|nr:DinB family protein [Paenibacillus glycanilyticus]MCM3629111.1 DinB family protein [Paenibacillus glycanilyticus]